MSTTLPANNKEQSSKNKEQNSKEPNNAAAAEEHKQLGNECIRNKQFAEAIQEYTNAIRLNPGNPILYSNRSFAYLKTNQLYYANEDAETCIQLDPVWAKGYYRRGEVQAAAGQYDVSLLSYGRALQLQPNDVNLIGAARRVAEKSNQSLVFESKVPWVGAGIGICIGASIVLADQLLTKVPTMKHPVIMGILIMVISLIGYGVARLIHYYNKLQRRGLLEPPTELLDTIKQKNGQIRSDDIDEDDQAATRTRYSKSQAWQRFKRGKSQNSSYHNTPQQQQQQSHRTK